MNWHGKLQEDSVIRGHHVYKLIWTPVNQGGIICTTEDNAHDMYTVMVIKDNHTVGYLCTSSDLWTGKAHPQHTHLPTCSVCHIPVLRPGIYLGSTHLFSISSSLDLGLIQGWHLFKEIQQAMTARWPPKKLILTATYVTKILII